MNDFDNLLSSSDFGFRPKGKSVPMAPPPNNFDFGSKSLDSDSIFRPSSSNSNNCDAARLNDLFGGASTSAKSDAPFNLNSIYNAFGSSGADFGSTSATSPPPVYNKSVYDDGIFGGVPGLKTSSKVQYDDVFASDGGRGGGGGGSGGGMFDDLIGGFSKEPKSSGATRSKKDDKGVSDFDDLLAGFGTSSRPSSSDRLS